MRERASARFILVDPDHRVLLFRVNELAVNDPLRAPGRPAEDREFWITPGGGVEPGETIEAAAQRELFEETGLTITAPGDPVHYREKQLENGTDRILSKEHFFCVRLPQPVVVSTAGHTDVERRDIDTHRWWTIAELETTAATIYPEGLAEIAGRLLAP